MTPSEKKQFDNLFVFVFKVAEEFFTFRGQYGPVSKLETRHFLVGPKIAEEFEVQIAQGKFDLHTFEMKHKYICAVWSIVFLQFDC